MMRDTATMALVETDIDKRNKYRLEKNNLREMTILKRDVLELKETVKAMQQIINKLVEEK